MKKKLLTLLTMAAIGAALVTGCGGGTESASEEPTAADSIVVEDESLPPLEGDLQQLYTDAYKIYNQISFGKFDFDAETTMEKDGFTYYKITDSRFKSYDDFQKFLGQYFTENFVTTGILNESNIMFVKGEDGSLYFLGSGRTENPLYAGHTFTEPRVHEEEVHFDAIAYYTTGGASDDAEIFYTTPENADNYTAQEFDFHVVKEDGAWKFDNFALFY